MGGYAPMRAKESYYLEPMRYFLVTWIPVHKKRTPVGVFSLGPFWAILYMGLIPYWGYHFTLFAQYAADSLPLAILVACRAWNDLRRAA